MARFVLKDAYSLINSVNLSALVKSITIDYGAKMLEATGMSSGAEESEPGFTNFSISLEAYSDEAAAKLSATMFPLVGAPAFPVEFRPTSAVRSATNRGYVGSALAESFQPFGGSAGDMAMSPIKLKGTGVLSQLSA